MRINLFDLFETAIEKITYVKSSHETRNERSRKEGRQKGGNENQRG